MIKKNSKDADLIILTLASLLFLWAALEFSDEYKSEHRPHYYLGGVE